MWQNRMARRLASPWLIALVACTATERAPRTPGELLALHDGDGDPAQDAGDSVGDPADPGDVFGDAGDGVIGTVAVSIEIGGMQRDFDLYVPASLTVPAPLVVDWHCYGCDRAYHANASGFRALADEHGFLVAYPEGLSSSFNAGGCCGYATEAGIDDVAFARALVAEVSARRSVDATRVYSTGLSNGGAMSHRLACEAADLFAAVAPIAFPLGLEPLASCQPSRPISVFHFHGLADTIVPYDGGGSFTDTSVAESFAYWGAVNACAPSADIVLRSGDSVCESYPGCTANVAVTLCSVAGGHILYTNDDHIDIAAQAWAWLAEHTLP